MWSGCVWLQPILPDQNQKQQLTTNVSTITKRPMAQTQTIQRVLSYEDTLPRIRPDALSTDPPTVCINIHVTNLLLYWFFLISTRFPIPNHWLLSIASMESSDESNLSSHYTYLTSCGLMAHGLKIDPTSVSGMWLALLSESAQLESSRNTRTFLSIIISAMSGCTRSAEVTKSSRPFISLVIS